jgi:hypothetical protein
MTNIFIYQIYYDDKSKAELDPGFIPLDNSSNERVDWREYHPIRKFLLANKLEDGAYYGFLSPRFGSKASLSSDQVKSFVKENDWADVVLFCPHFDQSSFFLNVFEQGELHHKGLMQAADDFFKAAGIGVDPKTLVNDSTNTIFANYFVARSDFWTQWFKITEQLYERCESSAAQVPELLTTTTHRFVKEIELKVFLLERLATLLLSINDRYRRAVYDPTLLPMPGSIVTSFLPQMIACDALKIAYRRLKNPKYIHQFIDARNRFFTSIFSAAHTPKTKPGRNELCYCGSGRKFKSCHGRSA